MKRDGKGEHLSLLFPFSACFVGIMELLKTELLCDLNQCDFSGFLFLI
jgi:hypothetical protein